MNFNIPRKQIIAKYKITNDIIRHINEGSSWKNENLNYPLRPKESEINNLKALKVIELLKNTKMSQKEIDNKFKYTRRTRLIIWFFLFFFKMKHLAELLACGRPRQAEIYIIPPFKGFVKRKMKNFVETFFPKTLTNFLEYDIIIIKIRKEV